MCSGASQDHVYQILRPGDHAGGYYSDKWVVPGHQSSHEKVEPE